MLIVHVVVVVVVVVVIVWGERLQHNVTSSQGTTGPCQIRPSINSHARAGAARTAGTTSQAV